MAPAKSNKVYVVFRGHIPSIYHNWYDCHLQVDDYSGCSFKSYSSLEEPEFHLRNFYLTYRSTVEIRPQLLENPQESQSSFEQELTVDRLLAHVDDEIAGEKEPSRGPKKLGCGMFSNLFYVFFFFFFMWLLFW